MIRNCLGITLEDMKRDLFAQLDSFLLGWLLDQDCKGGSDGAAALANFDAYNYFAAKKALDYLNNADRTNKHMSGGDMWSFLRDMMPSLLKEFAHRECNGQNNGIKDEIYKYKQDPYSNMYPNTLTDSQKEILLTHLQDTNFIATQTIGVSTRGPYDFDGSGGSPIPNSLNTGNGLGGNNGPFDGVGNPGRSAPQGPGSNPYLIINNNEIGTGGLSDKTDNIFGESILSKIPLESMEEFDITKTKFTKCFRTIFELDNFLVPDNPASKPIVTPTKVANLRRLFNDILMPIYRYYYGSEDDSSCRMRLHGGLTTIKVAYMLLGSSLATKHVTGEAVNFSLVTVSNQTIIDDIRAKRIDVDFGVCANVNGVYITLPTTFEDYEVRGVVLSSPTFDADNIKVDFT
jgi:hypothetical protein